MPYLVEIKKLERETITMIDEAKQPGDKLDEDPRSVAIGER